MSGRRNRTSSLPGEPALLNEARGGEARIRSRHSPSARSTRTAAPHSSRRASRPPRPEGSRTRPARRVVPARRTKARLRADARADPSVRTRNVRSSTETVRVDAAGVPCTAFRDDGFDGARERRVSPLRERRACRGPRRERRHHPAGLAAVPSRPSTRFGRVASAHRRDRGRSRARTGSVRWREQSRTTRSPRRVPPARLARLCLPVVRGPGRRRLRAPRGRRSGTCGRA